MLAVLKFLQIYTEMFIYHNNYICKKETRCQQQKIASTVTQNLPEEQTDCTAQIHARIKQTIPLI